MEGRDVLAPRGGEEDAAAFVGRVLELLVVVADAVRLDAADGERLEDRGGDGVLGLHGRRGVDVEAGVAVRDGRHLVLRDHLEDVLAAVEAEDAAVDGLRVDHLRVRLARVGQDHLEAPVDLHAHVPGVGVGELVDAGVLDGRVAEGGADGDLHALQRDGRLGLDVEDVLEDDGRREPAVDPVRRAVLLEPLVQAVEGLEADPAEAEPVENVADEDARRDRLVPVDALRGQQVHRHHREAAAVAGDVHLAAVERVREGDEHDAPRGVGLGAVRGQRLRAVVAVAVLVGAEDEAEESRRDPVEPHGKTPIVGALIHLVSVARTPCPVHET